MMTVSEISMVIGFTLQLIGFVVSGVWIVASIKSTSSQISITIEHLTKTLGKLEQIIDQVQQKQIDQEIRVRLLEGNNHQ